MQVAINRLMIVAPYRDEDAFLETMKNRLNADVELLNYRTDLAVSRGFWRRHAIILLMAFKAFRKSRDKNLILFGEQFVGLYYALFCRLFFWIRRPARSMVLQMIYNRKTGLKGVCYRVVYRWLIQSPSLNYMICHASLEREYYRSEFGETIGNKIFFVPFGRNAPDNSASASRAADERYFFAGGTSNRDYRTLVDAFRGVGSRLVIACHPNDIRGLDLPDNVTALHDVFGSLFHDYINRAYAVVLPILRTDVSAGQLVLIDAMRFGKACIVTSGSCMEDYVDQTCAVCVPKQDVAALALAVKRLDASASECDRLGKASRLRYEQGFTRRAFAERLCKVLLDGMGHDAGGVAEVF